MLLRTTLFLALVMTLYSCATIVSKSTYPVVLETVPGDADVNIVDSKGRTVYQGKTPATVYLKAGESFFRRGRYAVSFEREGYEKSVFPLDAKVDGWYFGNLVFGGLIGMLIVDPATGAMYTLDTRLISVALKEQKATTKLDIRTLDQLPDYMHPFLQELKTAK